MDYNKKTIILDCILFVSGLSQTNLSMEKLMKERSDAYCRIYCNVVWDSSYGI